MAKQTIGIGSVADDGTGDPLRTAFTKANENFTETYDRTDLSPLKTAAFTFTSLGPRVLVDTTSAAITGTLPASPAVGARCLFSDVADFSVNALTIGRNGELIEGVAADMTVSTKNTSGGFVFVGGSTGWKAIKS